MRVIWQGLSYTEVFARDNAVLQKKLKWVTALSDLLQTQDHNKECLWQHRERSIYNCTQHKIGSRIPSPSPCPIKLQLRCLLYKQTLLGKCFIQSSAQRTYREQSIRTDLRNQVTRKAKSRKGQTSQSQRRIPETGPNLRTLCSLSQSSCSR